MSGRLSDPWWNQSESEWKEKNAWIWHLLQRTSFKFHWSLSRGTKLIPMIMTQFEMSINNRQLFYEIGVNSGRLFSELRSMEQGKYSATSYQDWNEWLVLEHTQSGFNDKIRRQRSLKKTMQSQFDWHLESRAYPEGNFTLFGSSIINSF